MSRVAPFFCILLAVAIFFGYIKPAWTGTIAEDKAQIASYDSALSAASEFTAKEATLEQARDQIPQSDLDHVNAFLPDSVDNVQLILDLDALATRSGVELSDFTTGNMPNEADASTSDSGTQGSFATASPVDSLTLSISAKGTYGAFREFLAGVEQSLRPLDVISVSITDSDTGVYTYDLTLQFYWLH